MNISTTRLSLYALIAAVEADMRSIISTHVATQKRMEEVFPIKLLEKLIPRWQRENKSGNAIYGVDDLLIYSDFDEAIQVASAHKSCFPAEKVELMAKVLSSLQSISPIRNRVMHSRPLELDDFSSVIDIAQNITRVLPDMFSSVVGIVSKL